MAGGVNFELDAEGRRALQEFDKLIRKQGELIKKTQAVARTSRKGAKDAMEDHGKLTRKVGEYAAGLASVGTVIAGLRAHYRGWIEDQEKANRLMRESARESIDLKFLGENLKDPQLISRIKQQAEVAGRDPAELMRARYMLESQTGTLSPKLREGLWQEMLQHAPTTSLGLEAMVPLYAKTGAISGGRLGANEIQNIVAQFLAEAPITPQQATLTLPRALAAGQLGGLKPWQSAAFAGEAMQLTGSPEQGVTGMEAVVRNLMGKKGEKFGLRGATVLDRADVLRELMGTGAVGPVQVQELLGESGVRLLPMLKDAGVGGRMAAFGRTVTSGRDILGEKYAEAMRTNPEFARERLLSQADVEIRNLTEGAGDPEWELGRKWVEKRGRELGHSALRRWGAGLNYDIRTWLGQDVGYAVAPDQAAGDPWARSERARYAEEVQPYREASAARDAELERATRREEMDALIDAFSDIQDAVERGAARGVGRGAVTHR